MFCLISWRLNPSGASSPPSIYQQGQGPKIRAALGALVATIPLFHSSSPLVHSFALGGPTVAGSPLSHVAVVHDPAADSSAPKPVTDMYIALERARQKRA